MTKYHLWRLFCTLVLVAELYFLPDARGNQRFAIIGVLILTLNELFQPRRPTDD